MGNCCTSQSKLEMLVSSELYLQLLQNKTLDEAIKRMAESVPKREVIQPRNEPTSSNKHAVLQCELNNPLHKFSLQVTPDKIVIVGNTNTVSSVNLNTELKKANEFYKDHIQYPGAYKSIYWKMSCLALLAIYILAAVQSGDEKEDTEKNTILQLVSWTISTETDETSTTETTPFTDIQLDLGRAGELQSQANTILGINTRQPAVAARMDRTAALLSSSSSTHSAHLPLLALEPTF